MNALDEYWTESEKGLQSQFARIRAVHSDSSVKGTANEQIVAEFLRENIRPGEPVTNSALIDGDGRKSDEVDIAIVNQWQPIRTGTRGQILIAEGVDAVYQVKAKLTTRELRRAIKNGRSVKALFRPVPNRAIIYATESDGSRFIDRVPFFIFAFESGINEQKIAQVFNEEVAGTNYDQQPDGVFVLGRPPLINIADNQGKVKINAGDAAGLSMVTSPLSALPAMLWCHYLLVHPYLALTHPVGRYQPFRRASSAV